MLIWFADFTWVTSIPLRCDEVFLGHATGASVKCRRLVAVQWAHCRRVSGVSPSVTSGSSQISVRYCCVIETDNGDKADNIALLPSIYLVVSAAAPSASKRIMCVWCSQSVCCMCCVCRYTADYGNLLREFVKRLIQLVSTWMKATYL